MGTILDVGSAIADREVGADAVRAERARLLHSLLGDVDALAEAALVEMRAEIPAYAAQDETFFADVREQVAAHYRTKLATFLEGRSATEEDVSFARRAATRRARAGFALEDYLNAFRVGQQVLWDAILQRAGGSPVGHEAALSLVSPLMHYVDFASTHAAHAYVEFQQYVVADADRERRDLLEHLLAGDLPKGGPLLAAAQSYGIASDADMLVAAAVSANPRDSEAPQAASAAIARGGFCETRTLVVVRQAEIVAVPVLRAGTTPSELCDRLQTMQERLRREGMPLAMGISTIACSVGELPRAYGEARAALESISGEEGVAALPRLSPFDYLALRADATARRLVDARVRTFLEEDRARGGVLVETIRAFAGADLNLRVAAERLQIHPNTAQYRLHRIEERSGRNVRCIEELQDLLVAIALEDRPPAE